MTPEQKLIQIVDRAKGDDLYRARLAFRGLPDEELDRKWGQGDKTCRQILQEYEREDALYHEAKALLMRLLNKGEL